MKTTRQHHPAAALIPEATQEQYEKIREDIREHGQRVPITLSSDGQIIDGRTRDRACRELGIAPLTRPASLAEQSDAVALVISLNAARRHLSPDQMAAIYWSAAGDKAVRASRDALTPGGGQKRGKRGAGKTSQGIAKKIGVSQATVERVAQVQRKAPERLADVAKGKVSAAKVLKAVKPPKLTMKVGSAVLGATVTGAPDATPLTGIIEPPERAVPSFELQCDRIETALGWLEVRQERGRFRPEEVVLLGSIYARFGALMKREEVTA